MIFQDRIAYINIFILAQQASIEQFIIQSKNQGAMNQMIYQAKSKHYHIFNSSKDKKSNKMGECRYDEITKLPNLMFNNICNMKNKISEISGKKSQIINITNNSKANDKINLQITFDGRINQFNVALPQQNVNKVLLNLGEAATKSRQNLINSQQSQRSLTKRLKLKDYLRLNSISRGRRQKNSKSYSTIVNHNNHNNNNNASKANNFHRVQNDKNAQNIYRTPIVKKQQFSSKKSLYSQIQQKKKISNGQAYSQQIQIQKHQLFKVSKKAIDKLQKICDLVSTTNQNHQNYNDLVFMFRIQQIFEDFILKGIDKINASYLQHMQSQPKSLIIGLQSIQNIMKSIRLPSPQNSPVLRAQNKTTIQSMDGTGSILNQLMGILPTCYIVQNNQIN